MHLEEWRKWLTGHVKSLNAYNKNYRMVKAYGLVQETGTPVVFYFEKEPEIRENAHASV